MHCRAFKLVVMLVLMVGGVLTVTEIQAQQAAQELPTTETAPTPKPVKEDGPAEFDTGPERPRSCLERAVGTASSDLNTVIGTVARYQDGIVHPERVQVDTGKDIGPVTRDGVTVHVNPRGHLGRGGHALVPDIDTVNVEVRAVIGGLLRHLDLGV